MIRDDPAAFVAAAFHNVRELWLGSYFGDVTGGALKVLMTMAAWLFYGPLIVLGLLGVVQCWRNGRRDSFWAFVVMLSTTTLVHAVVLGGKRYRAATVDPQLIVLAAWQASLLLARWWQEPKRSQAIAGRR